MTEGRKVARVLDESLRPTIQEKIDNLNKPKGSLGRLEELAMQVCLVQQTLSPALQHPCHLLLGADHGIEREGVSASPREVTWQQMINFTRGGGGVNMFCRQHGFSLRIVDVGVDHDLSGVPGIINRKIGWGTRNMVYEPAMTERQMEEAIEIGAELADACIAEGCNVLSLGEMGIGNTSPAALWISRLGGFPLADCIGRGSGIDDERLALKHRILTSVAQRHTSREPGEVMRTMGGFEMVAATGAMLRAAERGILILVDGVIMVASALAAISLHPEASGYMIFTHGGDEPAMRMVFDKYHIRPLLNLGFRLGEGTGALCAYPIIDSAVRMINEMGNFRDAQITKYF